MPLDAFTVGSGSATAEASKRRPLEPVSTWTLGIVWHVLVPGTQSVTDVVIMFANRPVGPASTMICCTLLITGGPFEAELLLSLLPHETSSAEASTLITVMHAVVFIGVLQLKPLQAPSRAGTRAP